jgi:hypothetical protein
MLPATNRTTHMYRCNLRSSWVAEVSTTSPPRRLRWPGGRRLVPRARRRRPGRLRSAALRPARRARLVRSERPHIESKDAPKRRIENVSRHLPRDQPCLSGRCGTLDARGQRRGPRGPGRQAVPIVEPAAEVRASRRRAASPARLRSPATRRRGESAQTDQAAARVPREQARCTARREQGGGRRRLQTCTVLPRHGIYCRVEGAKRRMAQAPGSVRQRHELRPVALPASGSLGR